MSNTMITDITPSGYIMGPPLASTSRKLICLGAASDDAAAAVAAVAKDVERNNPTTEKWRHFMNVPPF